MMACLTAENRAAMSKHCLAVCVVLSSEARRKTCWKQDNVFLSTMEKKCADVAHLTAAAIRRCDALPGV